MTKSAQYIRFENKMRHFDADVELVSMLADSYVSSLEDQKELFPGSNNADKYPVIANRKVSKKSREIALYHLVSTVYSSYIKDLSEELNIYLRRVVKEAWVSAKIKPERLISNETSLNMTLSEILRYSQQGTIEDEAIDRLFQKLESQKSDTELIKGIQKRLGIDVDQDVVLNAVRHLDVRHKLVHTDGIVDDAWKDEHPFLKYKEKNGKWSISLDYGAVKGARKAITQLIGEIDVRALALNLIRPNTD